MPTTSAQTFIKGLRFQSYFDPDVFTTEVDNIFFSQWLYVCHVSQIAENGSYLTTEICGKPFVIMRGSDGVIRGFYNVCVHRGHKLAEGSGKSSHLTCRYHVWSYDCTGVLRRARGISDVNALPSENKNLLAIEIGVIKGFVFCKIKNGGMALKHYFHEAFSALHERLPMLEHMKFVKRFKYDVNANWKLMIENYLECYHCAATHPGLADLFVLKNFEIEYREFDITTRAPAGRIDNIAYQIDTTDQLQSDFSGWWLWPNLTFNVFPGVPNLLLFYILPVSEKKSVGYCDYFFINGEICEQSQALMDWETNILEIEDNELVESAQSGITSGALCNNIYLVDAKSSENTEMPLVHFNSLVAKSYSSI